MSAICQRLESALVRFLLQTAGNQDITSNGFALATHAARIEIMPTGLRVFSDDAGVFDLNFYSGESEEKVTLPAVIVTCSSAQPMEEVPNIQTADVEVVLEVQADSSTECDSVAWLDEASRWLHGVLSGQTNLARDLEIAEPTLAISYISNPGCGRASEGRRRIHRWEMKVVASH